MAKIYTRTGDKGKAQLLGAGRVRKDHPRLEAYGECDELNSVLGLVRSLKPHKDSDLLLERLQKEIFVLGTELAVANAQKAGFKPTPVSKAAVVALEEEIDRLTAQLPPLKNFILPSGAPTAAALHVARTVCRRLERSLQKLAAKSRLNPELLAYVNRLSDLLFTLARWENQQHGQNETVWRA